ncbi:MAG: polysaccharide deacetylase family protein, partial [Armatimonadetes bacterium]|nr:polysaccharide deacetylase family protein [Armatimonadota bacterium]
VKRDITPQEIIARVMRRMRPGAIVLMHCGSEATAQALPQLLQALEAQGYRAVTVSELLRSDGQAPQAASSLRASQGN